MLKLDNVSKTFGTRTLFEGVTLQINPDSRIGLVGRNGAGKSTLFRMIMGQEDPDTGKVHRMPGAAINCLTQEPTITPGNTLIEEVRSAFPSVGAIEAEEADWMARWDTLSTDDQVKACDRLAALQHAREQLGHLEADVSRMLLGLGFELESFDRLVEHFSGGWQMRINLAKVLLQGAEILLLDEPTNHLDLEAREWLEDFLKSYPGGLVIVSHDRQFLDQTVTEIAEVELGKMTVWPGNYSKFLTLKEEHHEKLKAAVERQQKELAKQQAFVDRFRASATKSTQAKSREKQLAKVERIEPPKTDSARMSVRFPTPPPSGRQVLSLNRVAKAYGANTLFNGIEAEMEKGQRIFLLGANGCGKTTLLRLILGLETPDSGSITFGPKVEVGYFSQHQLETLNPDQTALESLQAVAPVTMNETELRSILGRFLFRGDAVQKKVSVLSGGEKSRLALARLILGGANLLLLDEPTNHMDIPAQSAMEEAFRGFEGSLLCISHDRYLIQQVATDIWEIHEGVLIPYEGDYAFYLAHREARRKQTLERKAKKDAAAAKTMTAPPPPAVTQNGKVSLKQFNQLEKAILKQETLLAQVQAQLSDPAVMQDYQQLTALSQESEALQAELERLNLEWTAMASLMATV